MTQELYWFVVVKRELGRKVKQQLHLPYQSIYVSTLISCHQLWVVTKRKRSRIQAADTSFFHRMPDAPSQEQPIQATSSYAWDDPGEAFQTHPLGRRFGVRPRTCEGN